MGAWCHSILRNWFKKRFTTLSSDLVVTLMKSADHLLLIGLNFPDRNHSCAAQQHLSNAQPTAVRKCGAWPPGRDVLQCG